ncbi:MAG: hypothetical protein KDC99_02585 [Cyclobacteriaceae bacterium]|nr:hypothetical protein [Cyclobacteriaceae bacterium]
MSDKANFTIKPKVWESNFFAKKWGELKWVGNSVNDLIFQSRESIKFELDTAIADSRDQYELLEFNATADLFTLVPLLEDTGFRLADSRISFLTLLDAASLKKQAFKLDFPQLQIADFSDDLLTEVISLTKKYLTDNKEFISRYKNPLFFENEDVDRYFTTWVTNALKSEASLSCVLIDRMRKVAGYFIYEKRGLKENIPVYKGILTVIDESYRGKSTHLAMQSYLFSRIPELKFYVDNTTQLTNLPVIRNHIKSHRRLESLSLTFFKVGNLRSDDDKNNSTLI